MQSMALLLGCALSANAAHAQAPRPSEEALHVELRALKDRAVAAVNKRDSDRLMKELDPNISFTAMNNEVVHGIAEAKYRKPAKELAAPLIG
jgi:glutamine synthetase adenylyltransferase